MKKLISIGKMAKINHTTIPTLRLYDEKNLLKPAFIDEKTGYRYYNMYQNFRFDMITYLKNMNLSLEEIEKILEKKDSSLIEELLSKRKIQIEKEMESLKNEKSAVEQCMKSMDRYENRPANGTVTLEYIEKRLIFKKQLHTNLYDQGQEDFEKERILLQNDMISANLPQINVFEVATTVKKEDFIGDCFTTDGIFAILNPEMVKENPEIRTLEGGMFLCVYVDDRKNELYYAKLLRNYCLTHDYKIIGDYICEVMTEFNILETENENTHLRLQLPVKVMVSP